MALVRTNRVGASSATPFGTGAYTPTGATFTPANNSILVACVAVGFNSANGAWAPTISDTASGVWTQRATANATAGSWASGVRLWTCDVVTGTSRTISFDQGAVNVDGGYAASILEYTGQHATTPQAGATAKVAASNDGADSVTLTATPVADDVELGFLARDMNSGTATSTAGATFTELQDFCTAVAQGIQSEERTGSTSTTVDWADMNTAAGDVFRTCLAGIIIKAAAAAQLVQAPQIVGQNAALQRAATW